MSSRFTTFRWLLLALCLIGTGRLAMAQGEFASDAAPRQPPSATAELGIALPGDGAVTAGDASPAALDDFLGLAFTHNPALATARDRVAAMSGRWQQVGLKPNPVLAYTADEIGNEDTAGLQGAYVQQTYVRGNKLQLNRSVASHDIQLARQELAIMERRVGNDVRIAFYNALVAQQRLAVTHQLVQVANDVVGTSEQLVEAAEIPRTTLLQARLEQQTAQLRVTTAENAWQQARRQLKAVVGLPELVVTSLEGHADKGVPLRTWEEALQMVLDNSPEVAMRWSQIERAKCAVVRAQAEQIPNFQVQATVQFDDGTNDTVAGITIARPLLIHDWNQGGIRQASAELSAARNELQRTRLSLEQRAAAAFRRYQESAQQVQQYQQSVMPSARENWELVKQGFSAGESDYFAVLTAQRTYFQTYLDYLDRLQVAWQAYWELDGLLLTGSLQQPFTVEPR